MNTGYRIDERDFNKIIANSDKTIKDLQELIKLRKEVIKQLSSRDGKILNKRVESYVSIEGYRIHYSKRFDWFYINIYSETKTQNFEISLAGYQEKNLNIEHMEKQLTESEKQLATYKELNEHITEFISIYNTALTYYKKAESDLRTIPGFYDCNRW